MSLSTHVLDTANGRPASGMVVELRLNGAFVRATHTDNDGRVDFGPVSGGYYELEFAVGDYFGEAPFLDRVPIRFKISDPDAHYHVPLLISLWAYSTYRGH